jgi:hypothetical protein
MEMIDAELRLGLPGSNSDVAVVQPARKPRAGVGGGETAVVVGGEERGVRDGRP